MNTSLPTPTLTLQIDLRNPGLFFACCGLLELSHRIWGSPALGWFDNAKFFLHIPDLDETSASQELMKLIREMTFTATQPEDSGSPIIIGMGDHGDYRVDWWLKTVHRQSLRTWGNGTSYKLFTSLCEEGAKAEDVGSGFELTAKMKGRLSVDPRASWTAIDAGFSPNDQNFAVATFPLVEFLAGIGLQRNRPVPVSNKTAYWGYHAWKIPLPSTLITTAKQTLPSEQLTSYQFELASRGQMTRYFTYAIEGENEWLKNSSTIY